MVGCLWVAGGVCGCGLYGLLLYFVVWLVFVIVGWLVVAVLRCKVLLIVLI